MTNLEDENSRDDRAPRPAGRDEMNLAEFPFASLTRQQGDRDSFTYEGWITDKEGKRHRQRWTVRGAGGLGLPTEYDERVVVALMAVSAQQGFAERKVPFSVYQILQVMGTPRSKRAYEAVQRSLERLVGVTIYAEGAFWDNGEKGWIKLKSGFHIMEKYWLAYLEEDEQVRAAEGVPGYFVWSEDLWKSIQDGYLKHLDLDFYFDLDSPLARRLYRFLDKRMAYQSTYEIDIFDLAGRLGMARYSYPSKVMEKLQPALDELVARGFLLRAEVVKVRKYTRLHFERPMLPAVVEPVPVTRSSGTDDPAAREIVAPLVALGYAKTAARELVRRYDRTRILQKLDYLLWVQEHGLEEIRNPQGWLRRAIEEDWAPPDGYRTPQADAADRATRETLMTNQADPPEASVQRVLHERYGTTAREQELWQAVLRDLEGQVTRATYDMLFPHTTLLSIAGGVARIGVPNEMVQQWLAYRLSQVLLRSLESHLATELELDFVRLQPDEWC